MYRRGTTPPVNRTARSSKKQKDIAQRKRPNLMGLIIVPLTLVAILGSLLGQATPAYAVSFDAQSGSMGTDAGSGFAIPYQQVTPLEVEMTLFPTKYTVVSFA